MGNYRRFNRAYDPDPANVPLARRFIDTTLAAERPGATEAMRATAALLASELAANAVVHARTRFEVALDVNDEVVVSVSDRDSTPPIRRDAGPTDSSGRGLLLIDSLAAAWGVQLDANGKRVWCTLDPEPPATP